MKDYIQLALRTESDRALPPLTGPILPRLLHAGLGLSTESGEFLDALKKHIFYGKPLDHTNLLEEVGDLLWYCAIALDTLGGDFPSVMEQNIAKLRARFPTKFSEDAALTRNLAAERSILESFGCGESK